MQHVGRLVGHLRRQRNFGVAVEAQHLRGFTPELENGGNQRCVVELQLAEFGGAGDVGAIEDLPQFTAVGVLHHRQVGRHLQGEFPAAGTGRFGRGARGFQYVLGNAGQLVLVVDDERVVVGGVEQVFLELGRQPGQFLLQVEETRLPVVRQFGAAETEVAQLVVDDLPARVGKRGVVGPRLQRLEFLEQTLVLAELGKVDGDLRQVGVVGLAQFRGVHHRMQVRDLAPGAAELFIGVIERGDELLPVGFGGLRHRVFDRGAAFGQQLIDGGRDVFGTDVGKARQAGEIEQGVHGGQFEEWTGNYTFGFGTEFSTP